MLFMIVSAAGKRKMVRILLAGTAPRLLAYVRLCIVTVLIRLLEHAKRVRNGHTASPLAEVDMQMLSEQTP